ncbi:hypothetical protein OF83DRAFT_1147305 [Amylostereum chailletii]|nr:hypothetical protein OF83DRAFT_1147305 [Amylostereum chailletii]
MHIHLSSEKRHALCNSTQFLSEGFEPTHVRDLVKIQEDGWIIGHNGNLLLWVPLYYRDLLVRPNMIKIIGKTPVELDLSQFVHHGKDWTKCWVAPI